MRNIFNVQHTSQISLNVGTPRVIRQERKTFVARVIKKAQLNYAIIRIVKTKIMQKSSAINTWIASPIRNQKHQIAVPETIIILILSEQNPIANINQHMEQYLYQQFLKGFSIVKSPRNILALIFHNVNTDYV